MWGSLGVILEDFHWCESGVYGCRSASGHSPPQVDRIWLGVYYSKIPIYPIFYLLKGDYMLLRCGLGLNPKP